MNTTHGEAIANELPELKAATAAALSRVMSFTGLARERLADDAYQLVYTHFAADLNDLLFEVERGRGRQAMRVARSIFEDLVTLEDLMASEDARDRYRAHRAVTEHRLGESDVGLAALRGKVLRRERWRRKKLARAAREGSGEALAQWGSQFKNRWSPRSLRDRADSHGMGADYDFYELASALMHGASGGTLGLVREIDGQPVYRFGEALLLAPLAFSEGIRHAQRFVRAVARETEVDGSSLLAALDGLYDLASPYAKCVHQLDDEIWPEVCPPGSVLLRVLMPNGDRKWIIHDNSASLVIEAQAPPPSEQADSAEQLLDHGQRLYGLPVGEWVSIALIGLRSQPAPGAIWQPDEWLVPPSWRVGSDLVLPWTDPSGRP